MRLRSEQDSAGEVNQRFASGREVMFDKECVVKST